MNDMVSIIIPVYNGAKYITRCLNSVKNQTYKNIEIVIVNDGSIDNTKNIIESYEFSNFKYKVINKTNEGVSKARNEGIKNSSGKYVFFLDADDTLKEDSIKYMVEKIKEENCDVVRTTYTLDYGNKTKKGNEVIHNKLYNKDDINLLMEKVLTDEIHGFSCLLMIKKDILIKKDIKFPEKINYMEDFVFVMDLLKNIDSIYLSNKVTLLYYQNESSISKTTNLENRLKNINKRYNYSFDYIKSNKGLSSIKKKVAILIATMYIKSEKYVINNLKSKKAIKNYNKALLNIIDDIFKENGICYKDLDLKIKVLYVLIKKNYIGLIKVMNVLYSMKERG